MKTIGVLAAGLFSVTMCGGCGLLLGIDDFVDAPVTTSGSGGSGGAGGAVSTSSSSTGGGAGGMGAGGAPAVCMPNATESCYEGPPDSEGKGVCKAGTKTCAEDGSGFGPCEGQVVPTPENCAAPQDEDCNGTAAQCTGMPLWGDAFPSTVGLRTALDSKGNTLISGKISSDGGAGVDFGGGTIKGSAFVAKYDSFGKHLFSKAFGSAGNSRALVGVDASDGVALVGEFSGAVDFGGGLLDSGGAKNVFLAKFAADGAYLLSKTLGSGELRAEFDAAFDAAGGVVIAGTFKTSVDFGGGPLASNNTFSAYVARFDKDGNHVFSLRFGGSSADAAQAQSVTLDGAGNAVVGVGIKGNVDFGGTVLSSNSGNFVIAKVDPVGKVIFAKQFGSGVDIGFLDPGLNTVTAGNYDVAADAAGNIMLVGGFSGAVDLGGGVLPSAGGKDVFVARLDPSGGHLWSKSFGSMGDQYATSVAVDAFGNPAVTGIFTGSLMFPGAGSFMASTYKYVFGLKLAADDGKALWAVSSSVQHTTENAVVAVSALGDVAFAGTTQGKFSFAGASSNGNAFEDAYVTKFAR